VISILRTVNDLLEEFYKLYYEIEKISIALEIENITITELHVIEAIGEESISMNELSDKLNITTGTATTSINKLTNKNFIIRNRCHNDRRKVFVSLSKKGLEALNYHKVFHKNIISKITSNLSEGELQSFLTVFSKIQSNLKTQLELVKPVTLSDFPNDTLGIIIKVKGSPAMIEFFKEKQIVPNNEFKIVSSDHNLFKIRLYNDNHNKISHDLNDNTIDISHADAKNIVVTHKI
jgi:DNA-binding MarR family transcriptional regulator